MSQSALPSERPRVFGRRNLVLLAAGVVTLVAGYGLLASGSVDPAAALLVVGYCVLFPLALAL